MDEIISTLEAQFCYFQGQDAPADAANPYDYDGDGNRAAAWDAGFQSLFADVE